MIYMKKEKKKCKLYVWLRKRGLGFVNREEYFCLFKTCPLVELG